MHGNAQSPLADAQGSAPRRAGFRPGSTRPRSPRAVSRSTGRAGAGRPAVQFALETVARRRARRALLEIGDVGLDAASAPARRVDHLVARDGREPGRQRLDGSQVWRLRWSASRVSCTASSTSLAGMPVRAQALEAYPAQEGRERASAGACTPGCRPPGRRACPRSIRDPALSSPAFDPSSRPRLRLLHRRRPCWPFCHA